MSKLILFCQCRGEIIPEKRLQFVGQLINKNKKPSVILEDLCGICALEKPLVQKSVNNAEELLILACNKRSVESLLRFANVPHNKNKIKYINLIKDTDELIEKSIKEFDTEDIATETQKIIESKPEWPPWFPVVDYDRCISCGQCADFCLFGTYDKNNGKVSVVNPEACKNNCPACARICPETAIIFPKYKDGGAISGTDSIDEKAEQERMRSDVDQILGSDIYKALEKRKAKRKKLINQQVMDKALQERDNALKKYGNNKEKFNPFGEK